MERKLATIRKINDISNIEHADTLCVYHIDGWKVVDKIGKFAKRFSYNFLRS